MNKIDINATYILPQGSFLNIIVNSGNVLYNLKFYTNMLVISPFNKKVWLQELIVLSFNFSF